LEVADRADLVQDVFTVLVKKLPEFRYDPGKRFRAWLWTVTRNRYRERYARSKSPAARADADALSRCEVPDTTEAIDDEEYRQFLTRRALELMRSDFHPQTWQAFWELVVEECPAAVVAQKLGLTENAVYLAKGRVLQRLRAELDGLLD
jgi:RNA polymerase sigma-70 factor, ECF subfamily